jgi:translocator protein
VERSKEVTVYRFVVVVALAATLAVNALANILPLNGQATGEISDRFPVFITPPGYVFSIWSLIYAGLLAYAVYQALPGQRGPARLRRIAWPFVLSCLANIGWLLLWHYERFALTELAMLGLLACLVTIYARLRDEPPTSGTERWLVDAPFSLYLGWITVATLVNTTVALYDAGWAGAALGPELWTALLLLIGAAMGVLFALRLGDVIFALVIVWAFVGIALKHPETALVSPVAWAAAVAVLLSALASRWRPGPPQRRALWHGQ